MTNLAIHLALFAIVSCPILAQGPPEGPRPEGRGMMFRTPAFTALDSDGDGAISAAEIANAPAALKTLDKNGDGKLTEEEVRPVRGPREGGGREGGRPEGR